MFIPAVLCFNMDVYENTFCHFIVSFTSQPGKFQFEPHKAANTDDRLYEMSVGGVNFQIPMAMISPGSTIDWMQGGFGEHNLNLILTSQIYLNVMSELHFNI